MRKMLLWSVMAVFVVCGALGMEAATAKEPASKITQEKSITEGRRGRRGYHRRGFRPYGPRYWGPRRHYRYYAPPPPIVYSTPCYPGGVVIVGR